MRGSPRGGRTRPPCRRATRRTGRTGRVRTAGRRAAGRCSPRSRARRSPPRRSRVPSRSWPGRRGRCAACSGRGWRQRRRPASATPAGRSAARCRPAAGGAAWSPFDAVPCGAGAGSARGVPTYGGRPTEMRELPTPVPARSSAPPRTTAPPPSAPRAPPPVRPPSTPPPSTPHTAPSTPSPLVRGGVGPPSPSGRCRPSRAPRAGSGGPGAGGGSRCPRRGWEPSGSRR